MRYNHNHIALTVKGMLPTETARKWRETVQTYGPNGIVSAANVMVGGYPKDSDLYADRNGKGITYVVPLSRDLLEDEAGKIAIAWSRIHSDGDFEISFSQLEASEQRKKQEISAVFDHLAENIAKKLHAAWIDDKVSHHWRYSTRYNPAMKQHPMLLPWEQLPTKQKKLAIERAKDTLEILDSINLKICRK